MFQQVLGMQGVQEKKEFVWRMCEDTSQILGNVIGDIMAADIGDHTSTI